MASTYKRLLKTDVTSTKTLLHEAVPITGTILSGTYSDTHQILFSRMFQSVYDYPYLSSSAIIFLTFQRVISVSHLSGSTNTQNAKDKHL